MVLCAAAAAEPLFTWGVSEILMSIAYNFPAAVSGKFLENI
jgi:hypothetical protein